MTTPAMTANEARVFEATSDASAHQVLAQLDCGCEPYQAVFTFNRWKAQGFGVRKGERAHKLRTFVAIPPSKRALAADANAQAKLRPRTLSVFCACQVERIEE